MSYNAAPLDKLIEEFSKFPGIGTKGATRMAYQVLSMSDADASALAGAIQNAHTRLHRCRVCQNYTEAELCPICSSAKRDRSTICVVETPRDVQAFERTREYHGLYHVLHGLISPMDGIGVEQLAVKELLAHKNEIRRLHQQCKLQGYTLVPLSLYFKHGRVKMEVGLCKGKKLYDKRADAAQRDAKRSIDRAMKSNGKYY